MRTALIIISLAAIALGLVHIRRAEVAARRQAASIRIQKIKLRRTLWDQQVELGRLTEPGQLRLRAGSMALELVSKDNSANGPGGAGHDAGSVLAARGR